MSSILFYSTRVRKKLETIPHFFVFFRIFLVSGKLHSAEKCKKKGPSEGFKHPFLCKIEKNEGGPFGVIKKICEKSLSKPKKTCTKNFWSRVGLEPTSFCLADVKKAVTSMPNTSRSSVAQFSVSASQLITLIKSVSSLVFKKSHCYSLRFLRKTPTKN